MHRTRNIGNLSILSRFVGPARAKAVAPGKSDRNMSWELFISRTSARAGRPPEPGALVLFIVLFVALRANFETAIRIVKRE